jgi:hypothetical protein
MEILVLSIALSTITISSVYFIYQVRKNSIAINKIIEEDSKFIDKHYRLINLVYNIVSEVNKHGSNELKEKCSKLINKHCDENKTNSTTDTV